MPKPVTGREGNPRKLACGIAETAGKTGKRLSGGKDKQAANGMTTEAPVNGDATGKFKRKEKEGPYLLSCSENDNLHIMFDEWAKKHGREYGSKRSREERFKIFCASKKLVDDHNSLNPGSTPLGMDYFADAHIQCGATHEEESEELKEAIGEDILTCSKKDQLMRATFDKWAKKMGKTYRSEKEREERFRIFCASKKLVDEHNSLNLGYTLDLFWFSDMSVQCGASRVQVDCAVTSGEESEGEENIDRLKCDLPTLFDKWQKKYRIKYSSEEERNERFKYFCARKKRIDSANSVSNNGSFKLGRYFDRRRGIPVRKHLRKYFRRSCA